MVGSKQFACMILLCLLLFAATQAAAESALSADEILDKVESRYDCDTFSAEFIQTSTLKAMDISDTASGTVIFKRPKKFRWTYDRPDKQLIISDGDRLWIYKPQERQVMMGKAKNLFGEGRGASFLSDIKSLRADFEARLAPDKMQKTGYYVLEMVPKKKSEILSAAYLEIEQKSFEVTAIDTDNPYGDHTRIEFKKRKLCEKADDSLFSIDIPVDVDVVTLDNES